MIINTAGYSVLYDQQKPLIFVGTTFYNTMLYEYFSKTRSCYIFKVEEIENNDQSWFDQHQFMSAVSNVKTKYFLVEKIAHKRPHYFSVIGTGNVFADADIGQNTFIQNYNVMVCEEVFIGNHCTIGNFNTIGHKTYINDYCHMGMYSLLNFN
jgi:UDP-3-O-[3-hydroxymyristoyl] glucosamine N-acyltransferase